MSKNVQAYSENGVTISKTKITVGDTVILTYEGLLARSGADAIIAHIGYGELWEEKEYIPMEFVDGVFKVTFKVSQPKDLNISFKDSADNWDNNSQNNYTFKVIEKAAAKKPAAEKKVKEADKATESELLANKKKSTSMSVKTEKTEKEEKAATLKKSNTKIKKAVKNKEIKK